MIVDLLITTAHIDAMQYLRNTFVYFVVEEGLEHLFKGSQEIKKIPISPSILTQVLPVSVWDLLIKNYTIPFGTMLYDERLRDAEGNLVIAA